ncbi:MAG: hypothetical protein R2848_00035 [Thermomicrobiales bacterium]
MDQRRALRGVIILLAVIGMMGWGVARAQDATPEVPEATPEAATATTAPAELKLVDQSRNVNNVDFGNDGLTPGDMIVWGPDPLFDADDLVDTGSVTYGSCVMVNTDGDCMAQETFIFADGSTLEVQGLEFGATVPSVKTIVGGSGIFLGATGTLTDLPDEDRTTWTKHIEYWPGPNAPIQ